MKMHQSPRLLKLRLTEPMNMKQTSPAGIAPFRPFPRAPAPRIGKMRRSKRLFPSSRNPCWLSRACR